MLAHLLEQLFAVWTSYHNDGSSEESSDTSPPIANITETQRMNTRNFDNDCLSGSAQHGTDNPKDVSAEDPQDGVAISVSTNDFHPASDTETGALPIDQATRVGQSINNANGKAVTAVPDDPATAVNDFVVTASGIPAVPSDVVTTARDARDATSGQAVTAAPAAVARTPPAAAPAIANPSRFGLALNPTTAQTLPTSRAVLLQRAAFKKDKSVTGPSAQRTTVPGSLEWQKARTQKAGASGKVEQSMKSNRVSPVQQNSAMRLAGSRQLTRLHGKAFAGKPVDNPHPATAVYQPSAVEIVKPLLNVKPWTCTSSGDEQFPELRASILSSMTREKRPQQKNAHVTGTVVVSETPEANWTISPDSDEQTAAVNVSSQEPFSTATQTPTDDAEDQREPAVKTPPPDACTGQVNCVGPVEQPPAPSKSAKQAVTKHRLNSGIVTDDAHAAERSISSISNVQPLEDIANKVQQDGGPVMCDAKAFQSSQQSPLNIALPVSEPPVVDDVNETQQGVGAPTIDAESGDDSRKEAQDALRIAEEQPVVDDVNETQQGVGAPTIDAASGDDIHQTSQDPQPVEEQPVVDDVSEADEGVCALNPGRESQQTSEQDIEHDSETQPQQTSEQGIVDMRAPEGEVYTKRSRQGGPRGRRGAGKHKDSKTKVRAKTDTKAADAKTALQVKRQRKDRPAQHRNGSHCRVRPPPAGEMARRPAWSAQPQARHPSTSPMMYTWTAHVQRQPAPPQPPHMFVQRSPAMTQFGFSSPASTYSGPPYEYHVQNHRPVDFPYHPPDMMPLRRVYAPPRGLTMHQLGSGFRFQAQSSPLALIEPTDFAVPDIVFRHSRPRQQDADESAQSTSQSSLRALPKRGERLPTGRCRSGTVASIP